MKIPSTRGKSRFYWLRSALLLFACLLYTCMSPLAHAVWTGPPTEAGKKESFRAQNDIIYTGNGCSSSAPKVSGNGDAGGCGNNAGNDPENEKQIHDYLVTQFKGEGFSDDDAQNAAYGIMGNWMQESGMNSYESSGMGCNDSPAFGIAQWCGDRITKAKAFIASQGKPENCLGAQLEYAWSEIATNQGLINDMKGKSAAEAALVFDSEFEKSTDGKTLHNVREVNADNLSKGETGPTGGAVTVSDTSSTSGTAQACEAAAVSDNGECKNPFRDLQNSGVSRVDGGYDYGGSGGSGPVYAACPATITYVNSAGGAGWPGNGSFISYEITAGKAKGLFMYIAEDCSAKVKVGDQVDTNTPICDYNDGGTQLETGWGAKDNSGYVSWSDYPQNQYSCDSSGDFASNSGLDVDKFLQTLGLPHDNVQCASSNGSPPPDWPNWGGGDNSAVDV